MSVPPDYLYNQISRFPLNLLRYFGIPGGANPASIRRDYQPVFDLWEWLSSSNSKAVQVSGAAIAAGTGGSFLLGTAPAVQHQYVLDYTIRFTPVGAGGGDFAAIPTFQAQQGSGVEVAVGPMVRTIGTGAASANEVIVLRAERPFFFGPNAVGYGGIVTKNTLVNAITPFFYFRYIDLFEPLP